jgi:sensor histidine kinase regulating citrate/malate metabolism
MTCIVIISFGILCTFSYYEIQKNVKEQIGRNVLNTAAAISSIHEIQNNIGEANGSDKIQLIVEKIRLKTKVQFITVIDMNGIRYSHPLPDKIGQKFQGGDEIKCLKEGQTYISEGQGQLGRSLRGFTPIYREGTQVGAVSVGVLLGDLNNEFMLMLKKFIPYVCIGLLIGIIGSVLLSYSIKRVIFGLEPREVASNLRAQNHEFMNKLHTISGLIQLEEYDKALEFIHDTSSTRTELLELLSNKIKIKSLAGLILSKYNKASEYKMKFIIDKDCFIDKIPESISENDLIIAVGNLIENSIDAVKGRENGEINLFIRELDNKVNISIRNNGEEIPVELKEKIFDIGVSTKKGIRGFGLYNVKQIVSRSGGNISFTTGEETTWHVII